MFRRITSTMILGLLAASALVSAQNFAGSKSDVRVAVGILEGTRAVGETPRSASPHAWFNLEAARSVKPAGWNLVNPAAPSIVTPQIAARWAVINAVVGGGPGPSAGQRITKRQAAYWEVKIADLSDQQLSNLDVLLINMRPAGLAYNQSFRVSPLERERLRRFVDQGGILWIDAASSVQDPAAALPFAHRVIGTGVGFRQALFSHPLLSTPYALNLRDIALIDNGAGLAAIDPGTFGDMAAYYGLISAEFSLMQPFFSIGSTPTAALGRLGDGFVVITAGRTASTLNRVRSQGPTLEGNEAYDARDPELEADGLAAARFAVNLISLSNESRQAGAGSRKVSSTAVNGGAPLLNRFASQLDLTPGSPPAFIPPVVFKGLVIVSAQNRLVAYDATPSRDLDGDGDPDDGYRDYSRGVDEDIVWASATMPGPISAPSTIEVPDANGTPVDQVVVTDANGRVWAFNAFPRDPSGRLLATNSLPAAYTIDAPSTASISTAAGGGPYSVTFHEGLGIVADNARPGLNLSGRLWIFAPSIGQRLSTSQPWSVGGTLTENTPEFTEAPTVGYVPIQDGSGGLDRVIYVPTRGTSPANPSGLASYWIGARGERPLSAQIDGLSLQVTTRANFQGGLPIFLPSNPSLLGVRLSVIDKATGNPLGETEMAAIFTGSPSQDQGVLTFTLRAALPANWLDLYGLRVDYTIDWGQPGVGSSLLRGRLQFADQSGSRRVIGQLALSPRGYLFAVVGSGADGSLGTFWALREAGRGQFRCLYRWDLYRNHRITLNGVSPVDYPAALVDNDPVTTFAPGLLGGPFQRTAFQGGPVVRNDLVYVPVSGFKGPGFVPATGILAFDGNPAAREIRVGDVPEGTFLVQPDMAKSSDLAVPTSVSTFGAPNFTFERAAGSTSGVIRFESMMTNANGVVQHALSSSQPVILRRPGQPDLLLEPDRNGSAWNPLQWYAVFQGLRSTAPVTVAGQTLYMAGSSVLPSILDTGALTPVGILGAMNAVVSQTDPYTVSDTARPWLRQVWQMKRFAGFDIRPNPNMLWPQTTGVTSFEDWRVRLNQTTLTRSNTALGIVAGGGSLIAWAPNGVYAFNRADFVVADEGRLVRFDPSGNPLWASTTVRAAGDQDVSFTANTRALIRPTRAYSISANEMLVVDTGSNNVQVITTTGASTRTIREFMMDRTRVPDGFRTNDPLTLNGPRDAATYVTTRVISGAASDPVTVADSGPGAEYWVHWVIADGGNKRLIELIDRYAFDPASGRIGDAVRVGGVPQLGVLFWHSPATVSGKNFAYNSLNRVWLPDAGGGRFVYVAGIGASMPARADLGLDTPDGSALRESAAGNGGVIVFDPANPAGVEVINEILLPAIGPNVYWNEAVNGFSSAALPSRVKRLSNVSSVTARLVPNGPDTLLAIMIADASGVYEVVRPAAGSGWIVRWMVDNRAFRAIRRNGVASTSLSSQNAADLRATYARRLDSGEVLIVNAFSGKTRGVKQPDGTFLGQRDFLGEVVQLDGDIDLIGTGAAASFGYSPNKTNLGFRAASIKFELPPIQGARGLVLPVFADRR